MKLASKFQLTEELKALARTVGINPLWLISTTAMLKKNLLATDWRQWPVQLDVPANSQVFGRLVKDAGFDGILYPSTRINSKCVAIFPENLDISGSYVELSDQPPEGVLYTRLDGSTFDKV